MAQLSMEEREVISQMRAGQFSPDEIARRLGRHRSVIYRELARNSQAGGTYQAVAAQARTAARRRERPLVRKLQRDELNEAVRSRLTQHWSPDQIAGRLRRDHPDDPRHHVSAQTIYTWLANDPDRDHWRTFLRRGGRLRKKGNSGRIPRQVRIDGRPEAANRRQRLGDFEGDTILSGGRQKDALLTVVDRRSRYLLAAKLRDRTARRTRQKLRKLLAPLPAAKRRTMTFDNGKEFAEHEALAKALGIEVFFAHPHASWERGTNEQINGLLRQYYPKGTDFAEVSHQDLARTVESINNRPRQILDYKTPSEVFLLTRSCPCRI